MARRKTRFVCQQCGHVSPRWAGRCPGCGEWNSLAEEVVPPKATTKAGRPTLDSGAPRPISEVGLDEHVRLETGVGEFDRILGGGFVQGSAVLVGGDPGIGKSTLALQVCERVAESGVPALYVTGEESLAQVKLRAGRLGVGSDGLLVAAQTDVETVLSEAQKIEPALLVVDSIQMVHDGGLGSAPGSVSQVRQCAARLISLAKQTGTSLVLVGHVTKSGAIAGPKVLEHMVDTVLYFEGDTHHAYRLLRAVKNRFGSTNELGVFEMRRDGLRGVANPSEFFISGYGGGVGSAVVPCVEGTRPLLVEVQALVTRATYGTPERRTSGVDRNRVSMLLAVLSRRGGLELFDQNVFVNAAGGVQVTEPAADLGIAVAIASSFTDKAPAPRAAFMGEVGLGGEVRSVTQMGPRLAEVARLGFERSFVPGDSERGLPKGRGLDIVPVSHII
ncbi:MAG: DNA repair protein RadA, partial [Planctomycetota bacterium]